MFISILKSLFILLAKFISGASVRWVGSQPEKCQRVYFANHTSHLDAIVVWAALPSQLREQTKMVAARDYWDAGSIRRFIAKKIFNAILIEREQVTKRNNPIYTLLNEMGDEYSIVIFPEGGRGNGVEVNEFKSGIYYLAKKRPELELIPVYLDNMNRILPRGMILPVPMLSRLVFGPPIWVEKNERKEEFLERARLAVLKLKEL